MSESRTPARPSQVTTASWVAVIGSVLLVLTLFDSIGQIRSLEMRESIDDFLATSPGSGLGLDAAQILTILRGTMLFAGAAGAAAAVLAVYVLQRNQGARIGFTIAAVAIIFTAPVTGSPFAVLVAAAAMMLWTRPARDWFAGRPAAPGRKEARAALAASEARPPGVQPPSGMSSPAGTNPPPPGVPPAEGSADSPERPRMPDPSSDRPVPPPTQGFGSAGTPAAPSYPPEPSSPYGQGPVQQDQSWAPPAYGQQPQQPPQQYGGYPAYLPPGDPDKRPTTVTIAAWLTWVLCGLTLLVFGIVVLAMLAAKDQLLEGIQSEPGFEALDVSPGDLIALLWVTSAFVLFWCASAMVLAFLAYRRQNWARITLVVSAASAALISVAAITSLISLVSLVGAVATVILLFTGGANQWYSRRVGNYPSYPQQPYGQQTGQQTGQPYPQQGQPESGDKQDPPKNVW